MYELVDGPAEAGSLVEDNAAPSEGEESSMDEEGSSNGEDD